MQADVKEDRILSLTRGLESINAEIQSQKLKKEQAERMELEGKQRAEKLKKQEQEDKEFQAQRRQTWDAIFAQAQARPEIWDEVLISGKAPKTACTS
jgi:hypothetical protein